VAWDVVRFFLAFEMVRYGMAKIVGAQFYPQYWKLDMRPVDMESLAWVFFGRTYGYQAIGGVIEVGSAILVCFRRTTLLGACIMATALTQVVLVNYFYDVPVKLFASVYLAMDVCLIARDAPRLREVFLRPSQGALGGGRTARVIGAVVVALVLAVPAAESVHEAVRFGVFHLEPLEGAWTVDRRAGLDDLLPEAPGPWDRVYFEKGGFGFVRVGRNRMRFQARVDEGARTVRLSGFDGHEGLVLDGTFEVEGRQLHLEGSRGGSPFAIDMTREIPLDVAR
jgi:hypothetical protein